MERSEQRIIEWDCTQLLLRFYDRFDDWDYVGMADLFTEDGVWLRAGKELAGRAAIVEELEKRSTSQTVRHVITNVLVDAHAAEKATARCYLTAYQHDDGQRSEAPPAIHSPSLLLVVTAYLLRTREGWRIARQEMKREFVFPRG